MREEISRERPRDWHLLRCSENSHHPRQGLKAERRMNRDKHLSAASPNPNPARLMRIGGVFSLHPTPPQITMTACNIDTDAPPLSHEGSAGVFRIASTATNPYVVTSCFGSQPGLSPLSPGLFFVCYDRTARGGSLPQERLAIHTLLGKAHRRFPSWTFRQERSASLFANLASAAPSRLPT